MPGLLDYINMPGAGGGLLDSIGSWAGNNSNALIGLGAGIAGGGRNWNEALGRGLQGFMSGRQQDASAQLQNQSKNLTYQALMARGVPEAEARAAMGSPEMLRALTNQYFAPKNRGFQAIGYDGGLKPKFGWVGQTGDVTPYDVPR